jgi:hypothetical protein
MAESDQTEPQFISTLVSHQVASFTENVCWKILVLKQVEMSADVGDLIQSEENFIFVLLERCKPCTALKV